MVTVGVVHGVNKVVIRSSFSVIQQHKGVKLLFILPHVHQMATNGELRLLEVASQ